MGIHYRILFTLYIILETFHNRKLIKKEGGLISESFYLIKNRTIIFTIPFETGNHLNMAILCVNNILLRNLIGLLNLSEAICDSPCNLGSRQPITVFHI